ncbi:MAG: hypothetical protein ACLFPW_08060, partial [Spirochaetaceae bacterium]
GGGLTGSGGTGCQVVEGRCEMKGKDAVRSRGLLTLVLIVLIGASVASSVGIFYDEGVGPFELETVRGGMVTAYGYGIYRHMSADVAIQGVAQDYVTLFLGIPALAVAYLLARSGGLRWRLLLSGVLGYFLVTYLFYLVMGTYNELFLLYALLLGSSFFALARLLLTVDLEELKGAFMLGRAARFGGGFLMVTAALIGLLWLSVVVPPILDGSIYPRELAHYTTLVVQGLDLGLLLPLSFVSGLLLRRGSSLGILVGGTYLVFLSLLMTALIAKIVAMAFNGVNVIPAVLIIPAIALVAYFSAWRVLAAVRG